MIDWTSRRRSSGMIDKFRQTGKDSVTGWDAGPWERSTFVTDPPPDAEPVSRFGSGSRRGIAWSLAMRCQPQSGDQVRARSSVHREKSGTVTELYTGSYDEASAPNGDYEAIGDAADVGLFNLVAGTNRFFGSIYSPSDPSDFFAIGIGAGQELWNGRAGKRTLSCVPCLERPGLPFPLPPIAIVFAPNVIFARSIFQGECPA